MAVSTNSRNSSQKLLAKQLGEKEAISLAVIAPEIDAALPLAGAPAQDGDVSATSQSEPQNFNERDALVVMNSDYVLQDQPIEMPASSLMFSDASGDILLAQAGASEFGAAIAEEMSGGLAGGGAAAAGGLGAEAALLGLGALALAGGDGGGGGGGITYSANLAWQTNPAGSGPAGDNIVLYDNTNQGGGQGSPQFSSIDPYSITEWTSGPGNIKISIDGDTPYRLDSFQKIGNDFTTGSFDNNSNPFLNGEFAVFVSSYMGGLTDDVLVVWESGGVDYGYLLPNLDARTNYLSIEGYVFQLTWDSAGTSISSIALIA